MDKLKNILLGLDFEEKEDHFVLHLNGTAKDEYMEIYKDDKEGKYRIETPTGKVTHTTLPTLAFLIDNYGKKG